MIKKEYVKPSMKVIKIQFKCNVSFETWVYETGSYMYCNTKSADA